MANVKSFIARLSHTEALTLMGPAVRVYNSAESPLRDLPSMFVQPAVVQQAFDDLKSAHDAVLAGEIWKSDQRNQLRPPFNKTMIDFIDLVELAARNQPGLVYTYNMNFLLAGAPGRSSSRSAQVAIPGLVLEAVDKEPRAVHCKVRGGARKGIEIWHTYDDPSQEANWVHFDSFGAASFALTGLISGRRIYIRARYITKNGKGPWSELMSIMVP